MTITVFVIVASDVYKKRIVVVIANEVRNVRVDIVWLWSSCASVDGGMDGNKFSVTILFFIFSKTLRFCSLVVTSERTS